MSTTLTPASTSGRDHEVHADPRVAALARELDAQRPAIVRHCARMLGSQSDAEDATQETMMRAWRGLGRFEARSSLRTWLYAIATNVCLTMRRGADRRPRPVDVAALGLGPAAPNMESFEHPWMLTAAPVMLGGHGDPADRAISREDVRRAVGVALAALPARQRGVLFLRVVCSWRAKEVAELLGTSVAAVNSALQRARAALDAAVTAEPPQGIDVPATPLLARYVDALERADVPRLVALAREDAVCTPIGSVIAG